jgi:hypothetical protein
LIENLNKLGGILRMVPEDDRNFTQIDNLAVLKQKVKESKRNIIIIPFVSVIILIGTAYILTVKFSSAPIPPPTLAGITIFAVIYFIAQLSERVTELFSDVSVKGSTPRLGEYTRHISYIDMVIKNTIDKNTGNLLALDHPSIHDMRQLIYYNELQSYYDKRNREIILWAIPSLFAVIFTSLTLGLFGIIGVTYISHFWDSLFSGMIIGGGTKPLHDLISYIQSKP